ncbi:MAG: hypothetical protein FD126_3283, partial [Elusimicrobia bacterium]
RGLPRHGALARADDGRDVVLDGEAPRQRGAEKAVGPGEEDPQGLAMNG